MGWPSWFLLSRLAVRFGAKLPLPSHCHTLKVLAVLAVVLPKGGFGSFGSFGSSRVLDGLPLARYFAFQNASGLFKQFQFAEETTF
jgi:hypothetical protein